MFRDYAEQYVVFKIEGEEYGLPIEHVVQIVNVPEDVPASEYYSAVRGMMKIRGKIMPVFDVRFAFGFDEELSDPRQRLLIIEIGRLTAGLIVDEVTEVLKVGEEAPQIADGRSRGKRKGSFFTGMYKTPERIVMLFDLQEMLEEEGLYVE
ncbi:chemotaxis protein CheW [Saccharibacillus alkalitolerans]|uniref:Purine-binding chemotaxis protein CheW n=1 Tax=Saccharibacillus alkalitolerans TaxID=2705290 RepID=A0ABX0F5B4_9BACL|nr:chemotaxis protein CheW [Saccharibacillus alkalitolerans]NGZ74744.1 purine-binding chemotaxis protein CheW [Saccharibacillus alkalitolerans]